MEDNNNRYRNEGDLEENKGIHNDQNAAETKESFIHEQEMERKQLESKNTAYYSFGPYKSFDDRTHEAAGFSGDQTTSTDRPKQIWEYPTSKKKSSLKGMFASLLAGAVIMGSLMFASDQMNLFGGDQGIMGASSMPSQTNAASNTNNNGGLTNTALDIVRPNNIAQMVQTTSPAVVKIETFMKGSLRSQGGSSLFDDPFFQQFFDDQPTQTPKKQGDNEQLQPYGMGSGFIFDKAGYIITNQHVIEGADEIRVTVEGYEKPFVAKLLGESRELDLAALKIEGTKDFSVLNLGKSDDLNVGDWVVAIGNPYGFDHTVTVGVLSAKERPISIGTSQQDVRNYSHLLQTDASINPGNSGGPLLNLNGEVIGINTAISAQAQGIGFAIPTSTILTVLDDLKNNKEIPLTPSPFIGVQLTDIEKSWTKELNITSTEGSLIKDVVLGAPAYKAGLRSLDIITAIDGTKVVNTDGLIAKIKAKNVGDKVTFTVMRDGKESKIVVTIGDKNKTKQP